MQLHLLGVVSEVFTSNLAILLVVVDQILVILHCFQG